MREVTVFIGQIAKDGICVSASSGHAVHQAIHAHITRGERVSISFAGVTRLTTAFLNAAVGQLYGEFSQDELRLHLAPPIDTSERQRIQLKLVVDRAKTFFSNPEDGRAAFSQAAEIDD